MSFDFDAAVVAPFRMQPGLRRLAPGAVQLTPSRPGTRHLREKLAVFAAYPERSLLQRAGFDATPALHALARHAAQEHPHALAFDGGLRLHAPQLGWAVDGEQVFATDGPIEQNEGRGELPEVGDVLRALPSPWRFGALLALAFEEDFAVLDARDATVPWLAVALPSHWAPESKVGLPFAQVHAPVADSALLLRAASSLAQLLTGSERWERFVWQVTNQPRLHTHPLAFGREPWALDLFEQRDAPGAWFRSERQTFIPLPSHAQAVFTIHIDVQPLHQAVADPARANKLHDAVASMSDAVLEYRNLHTARGALLAWLQARAGAAASA